MIILIIQNHIDTRRYLPDMLKFNPYRYLDSREKEEANVYLII